MDRSRKPSIKSCLYRLIALVFLFHVAFVTSFGQDKYSRIRIDLSFQESQLLSSFGIDPSEGSYIAEGIFEADLSATQLETLKANHIEFQLVYDDVSAFYRERAKNDYSTDHSILDTWPVPQHWELGSMAGFYTLDEVYAELDEMHALYPDLITQKEALSSSNLTFEGREQYWVKISDNPNTNEEEPEVLYNAMHHGREPMSLQQLLFFMWHLLENYQSDSMIHQLVNETELYFIPVVNPDGFEYNRINHPDGGGMWRKNRRDNGNGIFGVDPNRNYGFKWGYNDAGSSPDPEANNYRGPGPFSEPEIQNVRDFCKANEFSIALNYHSYGNLLLYPWGYSDDPCEDDPLFSAFAQLMTKENQYTYGPVNTTIYPTNGAADDWMYGEVFIKDIMYSFTPEVGASGDAYWPSPSRIIPLSQEQMWQNIHAARLAGRYAVVSDQSPLVIGDLSGFLPFEIKRLGLTDSDFYSVSIQPLDNYLISVGDPLEFGNLALLEIALDSISFQLDPDIPTGTAFSYLISVDNGQYLVSDTMVKYYGTRYSIFESSCDDMGIWISDSWDTTTAQLFSSPACITDSPRAFYDNFDSNFVYLDSTIDLSQVDMAFVGFMTRWEIESRYDYVQFQIKDVQTNEWVPVGGELSKMGTEHQDPGQPVYDGFHNEWRKETIPLTDYLGKKVRFRFALKANNYMREDGFYFDDFEISIISQILDAEPKYSQSLHRQLYDAFPNPASHQLIIPYELGSHTNTSLEIFDLMGNTSISRTLDAGSSQLVLDVSALKPGVYFYRLMGEENYSEAKSFIKH